MAALRDSTQQQGQSTQRQQREQRYAMRLSVAVGCLMLAGKTGAYWLTGSAAILSDAAESVIHIGAVVFAAVSLRLISQPPGSESPYGYDRIAFLSAGFEGGMIIIAAIWIIAAAIEKWLAGLRLDHLGAGTLVILAASVINLALGWYLVQLGKKTQSLILEANGTHVLTDSWTSFGVVGGLSLALFTGWKPFDPICAIAVALNILWSGGGLVRRAYRGLMDLPDPEQGRLLTDAAHQASDGLDATFHRLRYRDTGQRVIVSLHLLLPFSLPLGEAHRRATEFERRLEELLPFAVEIVSHLESQEDHATIHPNEARR